MRPFWNLFREPINSLTHWFGALKTLITLGVLLYLAGHFKVSPWPFLIFGVCTLALYVSSATYHSFKGSPRTLAGLRKMDHSAIFLMIAGSFTPLLLLATSGTLRAVLLIVVWTLALSGIGLKMWTMKMPRWISTLIYLGMGWMAVFIVPSLWSAHRWDVLFWLVLGGVIYTVGGIIYGTKRINPVPGVFGFHEIWHLFVLGGSSAHFIMVLHLMPLNA